MLLAGTALASGEAGSPDPVLSALMIAAAGAAAALLTALVIKLNERRRHPKGEVAADLPAGDAPLPLEASRPVKGDVQRKKQPRPPFLGKRIPVLLPGRPEKAPAPQEAAPPAAQKNCPSCGGPSPSPGQACEACKTKERADRASQFVDSLKAKGVNVLEAERYIFQARSALALAAYEDVEHLCAQSEETARRLSSEHELVQSELGNCERLITEAIESGRTTGASEKALEVAVKLFRAGDYDASRRQLSRVPALMGLGASSYSPPATAVEAGEATAAGGEGLPAGAPEAPGAGAEAAARPLPPRPRCPSCGEEVEEDWRACPNCSTHLGEAPPAENACPSCGREVLPAWKVCPYCEGRLPRQVPPAPADEDGPGESEEERGADLAPGGPAMERELRDQIRTIQGRLEWAADHGMEVRRGRNLLELASAFVQSGNREKGERYIQKARAFADSLEQV